MASAPSCSWTTVAACGCAVDDLSWSRSNQPSELSMARNPLLEMIWPIWQISQMSLAPMISSISRWLVSSVVKRWSARWYPCSQSSFTNSVMLERTHTRRRYRRRFHRIDFDDRDSKEHSPHPYLAHCVLFLRMAMVDDLHRQIHSTCWLEPVLLCKFSLNQTNVSPIAHQTHCWCPALSTLDEHGCCFGVLLTPTLLKTSCIKHCLLFISVANAWVSLA